MARQRAGQLIVAERFVVPRHREVTRRRSRRREGPVRDLADEGLHELVLAALRRLRIPLDIEQLPSGEVVEPRLELVGGDAADGGERIGREDLADDRGVLEQRPIPGVEPVVAEALVNKGSALSQLGRRREAIALDEAALRMAQALPNRNFEMRVRNNLASVLGDDDPVRATQIMLDSAELAREIGDRGMYYWLTTQASWGLRAEARDWDEQMERLRGALDTATIRGDRIRLRSFLVSLEATRGEELGTPEQELEDTLGDSTDPDQHYFALLAVAMVALFAGDAETAYLKAEKAMGLPMQGAEGAAGLALRAAIWAGDHKGIRTSAAVVIGAPYSGPVSRCFRRAAEGAVAFVDGRPAEAVSAIREATSGLDALGQPFDAAEMAVDAVILMPGDPEIRRIAEEHRSVLESVGARPDIERLDAALASMPIASPAATAIRVEAQPSGS